MTTPDTKMLSAERCVDGRIMRRWLIPMADARDYLRSLEDQLDASMTREECMQLRAKIVRVRATIRYGGTNWSPRA